METVKAIILLLIGFVLLVKFSDIFVDAISSIASYFKMSKMMIALTIGAFGTCTPELAISFMSVGEGDIALANVIGSCIVNILLVIGMACLIAPIKLKNETVKKELPILLMVTTLFVTSIVFHYFENNKIFKIARFDGLVYIFLFAMFLFYIFSVIRAKKGLFEESKPKYGLVKSIIYTIICSVVIVLSSNLLVDNAKELSSLLNISTKIITMTIVVIGSSLPEMTMTVIAAKKGEFDIAIGNIIGTNIFNIGIVLGLPLLIYGGFSSVNFSLIDIFFVQISALLLYIFSKNDKVLSRREGAVFVILFVIYYVYLFIS